MPPLKYPLTSLTHPGFHTMQRTLSEILGKKDTKIQRLQRYLALNGDYELAGCRLTVRAPR